LMLVYIMPSALCAMSYDACVYLYYAG
jgi:hypothetical protein